jgi:hypothetical protein
MSRICTLISSISTLDLFGYIVPTSFVLLCLFRPSGLKFFRFDSIIYNKSNKINELVEKSQISEISLLDPLINSLNGISCGDRLKYIGDRISKGIDYAIRRHDWYEDQRSRIFQGIVAISSAMFVVCGWIAKTSSDLHSQHLIGFLSIALIALVRAIYYYNQELDASRPYRMVSDIRLWYFKYNVLEKSLEKPNSPSHDELAANVLDQRLNFFKRLAGNLDVPQSMREDLEQIFILQLLQKYKSESLTKMRWTLSYLIVAFGAQVAIWYLSK